MTDITWGDPIPVVDGEKPEFLPDNATHLLDFRIKWKHGNWSGLEGSNWRAEVLFPDQEIAAIQLPKQRGVFVEYMTEEEAEKWATDLLGYAHDVGAIMRAFARLNIIRPTTPLDKFSAAHPGIVTDGNREAIEKALAWREA